MFKECIQCNDLLAWQSSVFAISSYERPHQKQEATPHIQITAGGKTLERRVRSSGAFSLSEGLYADDEVQIDANEMSNDCNGSVNIHVLSRDEHPFSYRLARGCNYAIRKLTIVDDVGRQKVLFSKRVTFIFVPTM